MTNSSFTLHDLEAIIAARAGETDGSSYTAQLVADGPSRIAKKLGEEGVEAALACAGGAKDEMRSEAADLLYHLLVALHVSGVRVDDVLDELNWRTTRTGLDEKASRLPRSRLSGA